MSEVDRHLVRAIVDMAIWLEFSDDTVVDPDAAVEALEHLAAELQQMDAGSKRRFLQAVAELARDYAGQEAAFVTDMPKAFGLVDD